MSKLWGELPRMEARGGDQAARAWLCRSCEARAARVGSRVDGAIAERSRWHRTSGGLQSTAVQRIV